MCVSQCSSNSDELSGSHASDRFKHITFMGDPVVEKTPITHRVGAAFVAREPASVELDAASAAFFDTLCGAGGLRADRYRPSILQRRRAACFRAVRASSPADATNVVVRDRAAAGRALGAVMIGVTSFFRDPMVFESLRDMLRPLHNRKGIDAMSVACSDGSELYSLAMLLAEERLLASARLWGLDCRTEAVANAANGVYSAESVRGFDPGMQLRYLQPAGVRSDGQSTRPGPCVQVSEPVRAACRWMTADVFNIPENGELPRQFDLVMCRNLAIYLTPAASSELWRLLVEKLRPGGLLVVGKAERPSTSMSQVLAKVGPCIYRKSEATP